MVCGGFTCTKNSLCALNILYVVSRRISCCCEMDPTYVGEIGSLKLQWSVCFSSEMMKHVDWFNAKIQMFADEFCSLWRRRRQVLVARRD